MSRVGAAPVVVNNRPAPQPQRPQQVAAPTAPQSSTPAPRPQQPTQSVVQQQVAAPTPPVAPVEQTSGFDTTMKINEVGVPIVKKTTFTIADIKIGEWYDGFVKLKYNYGLFVTVK